MIAPGARGQDRRVAVLQKHFQGGAYVLVTLGVMESHGLGACCDRRNCLSLGAAINRPAENKVMRLLLLRRSLPLSQIFSDLRGRSALVVKI